MAFISSEPWFQRVVIHTSESMVNLSFMWEVWLKMGNLISKVPSEIIHGLEIYWMESRRVHYSENFVYK
jgi:hypothetical protein